ncbi:hypothetical protein CBR_g8639 [Chara braunii]|uniref:Uncharacterized protein n=1 Tax=Chara braunii TaxID=69332 RepID=A0A388JS41_CHABU|nr:hypothetical protein CBR_g8639 [Chara braunii]|eukprot:GBG60618.1 hypothetical protein CBR_g8639 [Chara braunii]
MNTQCGGSVHNKKICPLELEKAEAAEDLNVVEVYITKKSTPCRSCRAVHCRETQTLKKLSLAGTLSRSHACLPNPNDHVEEAEPGRQRQPRSHHLTNASPIRLIMLKKPNLDGSSSHVLTHASPIRWIMLKKPRPPISQRICRHHESPDLRWEIEAGKPTSTSPMEEASSMRMTNLKRMTRVQLCSMGLRSPFLFFFFFPAR